MSIGAWCPLKCMSSKTFLRFSWFSFFRRTFEKELAVIAGGCTRFFVDAFSTQYIFALWHIQWCRWTIDPITWFWSSFRSESPRSQSLILYDHSIAWRCLFRSGLEWVPKIIARQMSQLLNDGIIENVFRIGLLIWKAFASTTLQLAPICSYFTDNGLYQSWTRWGCVIDARANLVVRACSRCLFRRPPKLLNEFVGIPQVGSRVWWVHWEGGELGTLCPVWPRNNTKRMIRWYRFTSLFWKSTILSTKFAVSTFCELPDARAPHTLASLSGYGYPETRSSSSILATWLACETLTYTYLIRIWSLRFFM